MSRYNEEPAAKFLSTLPARGATAVTEDGTRYGIISIHAPREGSDIMCWSPMRAGMVFLSTLPARGATQPFQLLFVVPLLISIHAPREGSDMFSFFSSSKFVKFLSTLPARGATQHFSRRPPPRTNFYPRSPRGERR